VLTKTKWPLWPRYLCGRTIWLGALGNPDGMPFLNKGWFHENQQGVSTFNGTDNWLADFRAANTLAWTDQSEPYQPYEFALEDDTQSPTWRWKGERNGVRYWYGFTDLQTRGAPTEYLQYRRWERVSDGLYYEWTDVEPWNRALTPTGYPGRAPLDDYRWHGGGYFNQPLDERGIGLLLSTPTILHPDVVDKWTVDTNDPLLPDRAAILAGMGGGWLSGPTVYFQAGDYP